MKNIELSDEEAVALIGELPQLINHAKYRSAIAFGL